MGRNILLILIVLIIFFGFLFYIKNRAPIVTKVELPEISPSESPIIAPTGTRVLEIPEPIKPTTTIQSIEAKFENDKLEPNEIKIKEGDELNLKIINAGTSTPIIEIKGGDFSTSTEKIEAAKEANLNLKLSKGVYLIFYKIDDIEKEAGKIIVE
ncbi:MAG: cupredoxin domain-containing protein [Minisyncoccia bacterium]